ncbi:uncharacterized protein C20orf96 [Aplysia californica]|uniref:Uncharacterized protein C20orf96 n=1 Tax=Aplysia californica TaxID=6500 RepID=A0ABM1A430_APLCA|nr:uncharacterized protein C20orf96 [Aplysia californica]XP_012940407.1 uncharacterized protein C20orf96 [Aplysia californica]
MAAEWGKKAMGRIDRSQFANDELLKSLGNQLNVDFSKYDQWQRKERVLRPPAPKKKVQDTPMTFKVGTLNRACSADTAPTPIPRGRRAQARMEEERRIQQEKLNMLELKISNARQSVQLYNRRAKELIEMNLDIANEIESQEHETHTEVKRLLRKYEKFRGGIATLNTNFAKELSEAQSDLEFTKENIRLRIQALERELEEMDIKLKSKQDELNVLHSYKDKEYPVKAMMIANLHTEIESVKNSNQEDQEELEHIINTELGKYDKERIRLTNDITRQVTEEAVAMMHPSLKDMALQNLVMKKEIDFHKLGQEELARSNEVLEEEIQRLLRDPKSNIRLQMFPEFFPNRGKCTPDMDVVLDIPKQEWLPI